MVESSVLAIRLFNQQSVTGEELSQFLNSIPYSDLHLRYAISAIKDNDPVPRLSNGYEWLLYIHFNQLSKLSADYNDLLNKIADELDNQQMGIGDKAVQIIFHAPQADNLLYNVQLDYRMILARGGF